MKNRRGLLQKIETPLFTSKKREASDPSLFLSFMRPAVLVPLSSSVSPSASLVYGRSYPSLSSFSSSSSLHRKTKSSSLTHYPFPSSFSDYSPSSYSSHSHRDLPLSILGRRSLFCKDKSKQEEAEGWENCSGSLSSSSFLRKDKEEKKCLFFICKRKRQIACPSSTHLFRGHHGEEIKKVHSHLSSFSCSPLSRSYFSPSISLQRSFLSSLHGEEKSTTSRVKDREEELNEKKKKTGKVDHQNEEEVIDGPPVDIRGVHTPENRLGVGRRERSEDIERVEDEEEKKQDSMDREGIRRSSRQDDRSDLTEVLKYSFVSSRVKKETDEEEEEKSFSRAEKERWMRSPDQHREKGREEEREEEREQACQKRRREEKEKNKTRLKQGSRRRQVDVNDKLLGIYLSRHLTTKEILRLSEGLASTLSIHLLEKQEAERRRRRITGWRGLHGEEESKREREEEELSESDVVDKKREGGIKSARLDLWNCLRRKEEEERGKGLSERDPLDDTSFSGYTKRKIERKDPFKQRMVAKEKGEEEDKRDVFSLLRSYSKEREKEEEEGEYKKRMRMTREYELSMGLQYAVVARYSVSEIPKRFDTPAGCSLYELEKICLSSLLMLVTSSNVHHRLYNPSEISSLLFHASSLARRVPGVYVHPNLAYLCSKRFAYETSKFSPAEQTLLLASLPGIVRSIPPDPLFTSALCYSLSSILQSSLSSFYQLHASPFSNTHPELPSLSSSSSSSSLSSPFFCSFSLSSSSFLLSFVSVLSVLWVAAGHLFQTFSRYFSELSASSFLLFQTPSLLDQKAETSSRLIVGEKISPSQMSPSSSPSSSFSSSLSISSSSCTSSLPLSSFSDIHPEDSSCRRNSSVFSMHSKAHEDLASKHNCNRLSHFSSSSPSYPSSCLPPSSSSPPPFSSMLPLSSIHSQYRSHSRGFDASHLDAEEEGEENEVYRDIQEALGHLLHLRSVMEHLTLNLGSLSPPSSSFSLLEISSSLSSPFPSPQPSQVYMEEDMNRKKNLPSSAPKTACKASRKFLEKSSCVKRKKCYWRKQVEDDDLDERRKSKGVVVGLRDLLLSSSYPFSKESCPTGSTGGGEEEERERVRKGEEGERICMTSVCNKRDEGIVGESIETEKEGNDRQLHVDSILHEKEDSFSDTLQVSSSSFSFSSSSASSSSFSGSYKIPAEENEDSLIPISKQDPHAWGVSTPPDLSLDRESTSRHAPSTDLSLVDHEHRDRREREENSSSSSSLCTSIPGVEYRSYVSSSSLPLDNDHFSSSLPLSSSPSTPLSSSPPPLSSSSPFPLSPSHSLPHCASSPFYISDRSRPHLPDSTEERKLSSLFQFPSFSSFAPSSSSTSRPLPLSLLHAILWSQVGTGALYSEISETSMDAIVCTLGKILRSHEVTETLRRISSLSPLSPSAKCRLREKECLRIATLLEGLSVLFTNLSCLRYRYLHAIYPFIEAIDSLLHAWRRVHGRGGGEEREEEEEERGYYGRELEGGLSSIKEKGEHGDDLLLLSTSLPNLLLSLCELQIFHLCSDSTQRFLLSFSLRALPFLSDSSLFLLLQSSLIFSSSSITSIQHTSRFSGDGFPSSASSLSSMSPSSHVSSLHRYSSRQSSLLQGCLLPYTLLEFSRRFVAGLYIPRPCDLSLWILTNSIIQSSSSSTATSSSSSSSLLLMESLRQYFDLSRKERKKENKERKEGMRKEKEVNSERMRGSALSSEDQENLRAFARHLRCRLLSYRSSQVDRHKLCSSSFLSLSPSSPPSFVSSPRSTTSYQRSPSIALHERKTHRLSSSSSSPSQHYSVPSRGCAWLAIPSYTSRWMNLLSHALVTLRKNDEESRDCVSLLGIERDRKEETENDTIPPSRPRTPSPSSESSRYAEEWMEFFTGLNSSDDQGSSKQEEEEEERREVQEVLSTFFEKRGRYKGDSFAVFYGAEEEDEERRKGIFSRKEKHEEEIEYREEVETKRERKFHVLMMIAPPLPGRREGEAYEAGEEEKEKKKNDDDEEDLECSSSIERDRFNLTHPGEKKKKNEKILAPSCPLSSPCGFSPVSRREEKGRELHVALKRCLSREGIVLDGLVRNGDDERVAAILFDRKEFWYRDGEGAGERRQTSTERRLLKKKRRDESTLLRVYVHLITRVAGLPLVILQRSVQ